eukprot:CAMPEP_0201526090 /NCGR_PEP_ID=MMETSP0161_2-20130828/30594_1 /ASSEMBLY_ACC=CAM_ASM_000251 /TAXON_ID=180227 /ORGANISM="Neoparamoeba aestuarina, Strain SoJaBio B1-5/56/2" /LENGTH=146 /DNA_ID=CAMNT_0047926323 /DNA_START=1 /DNA_END=441 /DNA_ORIENTATION=-
MDLFSQHLITELSIENALFWKALKVLEVETEKEKRREIFEDIYERYIENGAESQVNFSYEVLGAVRATKNNPEEEFSNEIFEGPKRELIALLKMDSLTRFKSSALFSEYLEGMEMDALRDIVEKRKTGKRRRGASVKARGTVKKNE